MNEELAWLGAVETARLIRSHEVSASEVVEAALEALERTEGAINAFVTVTAERARAEASAADRLTRSSDAQELPLLHGVPVSVKDLSNTAGVRTTYGSVDFSDYVPATSSVAWSRLQAAGAILIGKTTTPEFGMLGITESVLTGTTNNPWNIERVAGGSSGGAASSVAAGVGAAAWGSDGGGSIRIPAAYCGVVGLKPSRGRIPVDEAWESVGTDGPIARSVADAALLLQATAGPSRRDPLSLPFTGEDFLASALTRPSRLRIAYSPDFGTAEIDTDVRRVVDDAVQLLRDLGHTVDLVDIDLPDPIQYFIDYWSPAFALAVGADVLADDARASSIHPVTREIGLHGTELSALDHLRTSTRTRGLISSVFANIFDEYDVIVTPTSPVTAFPHPGPPAGPLLINNRPVSRPMLDFHRLTEPASHAGLPAISIPCGFDRDRLPVGLQIIGDHHSDALILAVAGEFERETSWHRERPQARRA